MKVPPVGSVLFHTDRQTDRHDEANSRFSQFSERALKKNKFRPITCHEFQRGSRGITLLFL